MRMVSPDLSRFRFSLQNILNMKEKLENQAKNEYGQANARLIAEQKKLDELTERFEEAQQQLKNILQEALSMMEIRTREKAIDVLKEYVVQQKLLVLRCEKEVEFAREKLEEAMKERKVYEKLRERAFEEFMREQNRREQKEVDELVSYKYGTKATNV